MSRIGGHEENVVRGRTSTDALDAANQHPYGEQMTDQSPGVYLSHPPAALLRFANPLLAAVLRTPLPFPMRDDMMVVTVTGRKTGRKYTIPLSAHFVDDALYAITTAPWKYNFRDGATAQVLHNGKTTTMHGELITDRDVVADLLLRCSQSYGVRRAQSMIGVKFRDKRIPTLPEFTEAVTRDHFAAIRFTSSS